MDQEEIFEYMEHFLVPEAINKWWENPIPEAGGKTPQHLYEDDPELLQKIIKGYDEQTYDSEFAPYK